MDSIGQRGGLNVSALASTAYGLQYVNETNLAVNVHVTEGLNGQRGR